MPRSQEDPPTYDEGTQTSDTISFNSYADGTLTLYLANAGQAYTLGSNGTNDELDLQLGSSTATISLTFEYGALWTQQDVTVTVTFDGVPQTLPYSSPAVSPSDIPHHFSITVIVGLVQLVWDPKIKVIAPPRH